MPLLKLGRLSLFFSLFSLTLHARPRDWIDRSTFCTEAKVFRPELEHFSKLLNHELKLKLLGYNFSQFVMSMLPVQKRGIENQSEKSRGKTCATFLSSNYSQILAIRFATPLAVGVLADKIYLERTHKIYGDYFDSKFEVLNPELIANRFSLRDSPVFRRLADEMESKQARGVIEDVLRERTLGRSIQDAIRSACKKDLRINVPFDASGTMSASDECQLYLCHALVP